MRFSVFLNIYIYIYIYTVTPRSLKQCLSFKILHHNSVWISLLSQVCQCCAHQILHEFLTLIVFGITNHKAPHHSVYSCLLIHHVRPKCLSWDSLGERPSFLVTEIMMFHILTYTLNSKLF